MNDLTRLDDVESEDIDDSDELPPPATLDGFLPPKESRITQKQADRAIKRAGLIGVKASKIKGLSDLGKYAEQVGMFRLGAGFLVGTMSQAQALYAESVRQVGQIKDNPEIVMRHLELQDSVLGKYMQAASLYLKAGDKPESSSNSAPTQMPFPPNTPIAPHTAIQINGVKDVTVK